MPCSDCSVPHALRRPVTPTPITLLSMNAFPTAPRTTLQYASAPAPMPVVRESPTRYRVEINRRGEIRPVDLAALIQKTAAPILGDVRAGIPAVPTVYDDDAFEIGDPLFIRMPDDTFVDAGIEVGDVVEFDSDIDEADSFFGFPFRGRAVMMIGDDDRIHFGYYFPGELVKAGETISTDGMQVVGVLRIMCRRL